MSFWIFLWWPATCFFHPFCVSVFGVILCGFKQAPQFDVFSCSSTSTRFSVFVFLSSLSCLTSSGAFRSRVFPLNLIAQTLHASIVQWTRVSWWGISFELMASNHPWSLQTYFHNEARKLTRCCLWIQDARILGHHTFEEPNPTSKNLFLPDTAGKITRCLVVFCVGRVALSILAYSRKQRYSAERSSQSKGWHCCRIHFVQPRQDMEVHDRTLAEAPVADLQVLLPEHWLCQGPSVLVEHSEPLPATACACKC